MALAGRTQSGGEERATGDFLCLTQRTQRARRGRLKARGGHATENYPRNCRNYPKTTQKIIDLIKNDPEITKEELAEKCEISSNGVRWQLKKLKRQGVIRRVGPNKGGYREVVKEE
ncbi:MAG: winged helix-turn-helix domain-containing protein [Bacteroidales bacterium]|nr:winged helix-turn-helix domain-containing protein [Bacteroidales bacterium]